MVLDSGDRTALTYALLLLHLEETFVRKALRGAASLHALEQVEVGLGGRQRPGVQDSDEQVEGLEGVGLVVQQEAAGRVAEFEQLRSDLHARVDAHLAVVLRVGVEDLVVVVFQTSDQGLERSRAFVLVDAQKS